MARDRRDQRKPPGAGGLRFPVGEYSRQVIIQRIATPEARTATGDVLESWQDLATRWARIAPTTGREVSQGQQMQGATTHQINLIGCYAGLVPKDRLKMGTRIFAIESVLDLGDGHTEQQLTVVERV